MASNKRALTTRLLRSSASDPEANSAQLLDLVGDELRAIAAGYLRGERRNHTLQPTALVNEAYLRLVDSSCLQANDRSRFLKLAARAMRHVLVDFARKRNAERRGGAEWGRVTLHPELARDSGDDVDLVELNDLLSRFASVDGRAAQVVELRFFAGLSIDETAEALNVSGRTVDNDWFVARTWLARELKRPAG